ncbi:MAG: dolichol kinase [Halobacteria archaeon]|nr:dolichol kinase [Halobacteria archaeon]
MYRRLFHLSGSLYPLLHVSGLLTWDQMRLLSWIGITVAAVLEYLRLRGDVVFFESLYRDYERESIAGYVLAGVGLFLSVNLFPPSIGTASMFMLTVADPIAGAVGTGELRRVKKPRVLVTAFCVSLAVSLLFVSPLVGAAGALGAALGDGVKLRLRGYVIDDNLTIPVYSGTVMTVVSQYFGSAPVIS